MSSTFNDPHHHPKREPNENSGTGNFYQPSPPPLKLNKDSHVIKKPPSPSYSSTASAATKPRHPVIIYTHVPKVIHTNPKDFMALVQKLTGMSRSDEIPAAGKSNNSDPTGDRKINRRHNTYSAAGSGNNNGKGMFFNNPMISEDSESSSVITTDENVGEHGQVNSSLPYSTVAVAPPPPPPPPPPPSSPFMYDTAGINYGNYLPTFPIFPPATNPADGFLCGNQTFGNLDDPFCFGANMRSSFSSSSSSGFDGLTEFRDF